MKNRFDEGVAALVSAALADDASERTLAIVSALSGFAPWRALSLAGLEKEQRVRLQIAILDAAIREAEGG